MPVMPIENGSFLAQYLIDVYVHAQPRTNFSAKLSASLRIHILLSEK